VIIGSILVPSTALALPTFLLFAKMNLTDTMWAVIIPSLLNPFGLFLMRVYSDDAVPDSLLEAARVDGASEARIFWQISFRLLAPGFVTVLLFTLVTTWNNFFLPLIMLKNQSLYPVSVGLNQLFTLTNNAGGSGGSANHTAGCHGRRAGCATPRHCFRVPAEVLDEQPRRWRGQAVTRPTCSRFWSCPMSHAHYPNNSNRGDLHAPTDPPTQESWIA